MRSPSSLLFWLIVIAVVAGAAHLTREYGLLPASAPGSAEGRIEQNSTGPALSGRAKVVDGDSLDIAGRNVRLAGIDAPEGRQQCEDARGRSYACGREAARALSALIAGRRVTCTGGDHDRYDRDVARCAVDGRDLGEAMVRAGHAVELPQFSGGRYAAAQREARDAKRGLWAGRFEQPSAWRRNNMERR